MTRAHQTGYFEHLMTFSTTHEVRFREAVISHNGETLAKAGDKLDDIHRQIVKAKLKAPLETSIVVTPTLNARMLKAAFDSVLEKHPDVRLIVEQQKAHQAILPMLQMAQSYGHLFQKLTVMQVTLESVFERCLINAALSLSLSIHNKVPKSRAFRIFILSLVENIGYLHLKPGVHNASQSHVDFWKEYIVHPMIGEQVLKRVQGLPSEIIQGVGHSHEREDGTGFPLMMTNHICPLTKVTSLIDELTRLKFNRQHKPSINIAEAMALLQFRGAHFNPVEFSQLQKMVSKAKLPHSLEIKESELGTFARMQMVYYSKCLVYCDIIARIIESTSMDKQNKSVNRLNRIANGFIHSVFSSGMLSVPIKRLIQECIETKQLDLVADMIDIDHAHNGILDRIDEILSLLEYTVESNQNSSAMPGLSSCLEYSRFVQKSKEASIGWPMLIEQLYDGHDELGSIIHSIAAK